MDLDYKEVLRLSVELELGMARLYRLFSERFPDDADFWWKLSREEIHHASLLRTGEKYIHIDYPTEILCHDVEVLKGLHAKIEHYCIQLEEGEITREDAMDLAIEFEGGAGEMHYQVAMTLLSSNELLHIFRELNAQDLNHIKRVREYKNRVLQEK
ncbi:MAG: hypothetical protein ABIK28_07085 [Planctomycetota bacterium]